MKTKIFYPALVAMAALSTPAFAQWEDGVAAVTSGFWEDELYFSGLGRPAPVAPSPNSTNGAQSGQNVRNDESAPLSDAHWEFTHEMVDLDGDGNVSRNELIGMLEGGKLRADTSASGWVAYETWPVRTDTSNTEAVSVELGNGTLPLGYEAVTLEQGVMVDSPFSILSARREARFAGADADGNGSIDLQEMMQLRRAFMQARGNENAGNDEKVRKQARRIIQRIDTNGDQMISRQELAISRGNLEMQRLDTDGDGQISPAEWDVTSN